MRKLPERLEKIRLEYYGQSIFLDFVTGHISNYYWAKLDGGHLWSSEDLKQISLAMKLVNKDE